jgi:hypothetical protein
METIYTSNAALASLDTSRGVSFTGGFHNGTPEQIDAETGS